jgi:hypothetical protein
MLKYWSYSIRLFLYSVGLRYSNRQVCFDTAVQYSKVYHSYRMFVHSLLSYSGTAVSLFLAAAATAPCRVGRIVRIHLVGPVVGARLVRRAIRIALIRVVIHPGLVGATVRVHLIRVMVAVSLLLLLLLV